MLPLAAGSAARAEPRGTARRSVRTALLPPRSGGGRHDLVPSCHCGKSRFDRVFRFVAAKIGCRAIPDSWSLIAVGRCDSRAERMRGHVDGRTAGSVATGWPSRPWSFLVDGPQIARTPRRVVGEADRRSFVFPRRCVARWSSSSPSGISAAALADVRSDSDGPSRSGWFRHRGRASVRWTATGGSMAADRHGRVAWLPGRSRGVRP